MLLFTELAPAAKGKQARQRMAGNFTLVEYWLLTATGDARYVELVDIPGSAFMFPGENYEELSGEHQNDAPRGSLRPRMCVRRAPTRHGANRTAVRGRRRRTLRCFSARQAADIKARNLHLFMTYLHHQAFTASSVFPGISPHC